MHTTNPDLFSIPPSQVLPPPPPINLFFQQSNNPVTLPPSSLSSFPSLLPLRASRQVCVMVISPPCEDQAPLADSRTLARAECTQNITSNYVVFTKCPTVYTDDLHTYAHAHTNGSVSMRCSLISKFSICVIICLFVSACVMSRHVQKEGI